VPIYELDDAVWQRMCAGGSVDDDDDAAAPGGGGGGACAADYGSDGGDSDGGDSDGGGGGDSDYAGGGCAQPGRGKASSRVATYTGVYQHKSRAGAAPRYHAKVSTTRITGR
jgi:hypothetical protein